MSAANPNPMEKSMVSVLVVANAGGGSPFSSPYTTESAVIDRRRKLEEAAIDDEDKESMDEGTMLGI
jgi:hypothetical protein